MDKSTKQLLQELLASGKSQHEISRSTGVGQATLSRVLNGVNQSEYSRHHSKILTYHRKIFPILN